MVTVCIVTMGAFCKSLLSVFSLGGLVLDYTVVSYDEVAVFQPVINGTYMLSMVRVISLSKLF